MCLSRVLIHRYDNEADILAALTNGCSDVYRRTQDNAFEWVAIVPTGKAGTEKAVIARANGGQYIAPDLKVWPGRPDTYPIRVDLDEPRLVDIHTLRAAIGANWPGPWTVRVTDIDASQLCKN